MLGTAVGICWPLVSLHFSLAPNHTHCLQPRCGSCSCRTSAGRCSLVRSYVLATQQNLSRLLSISVLCWISVLGTAVSSLVRHRFLCGSASPHTHRLQPSMWLKHSLATMQGCLAKHAGTRYLCHCHCLLCRLPYAWRLSVTHQVVAHLPAAMSPLPLFVLQVAICLAAQCHSPSCWRICLQPCPCCPVPVLFWTLVLGEQLAFVGHWFLCSSASPQTIHIACSVCGSCSCRTSAGRCSLARSYVLPTHQNLSRSLSISIFCWIPVLGQQLTFVSQRLLCSAASPHTHRLQPCSWLKHLPATMQGCLAKHAGTRYRATAIACFAGCHMFGGSVSLTKLLKCQNHGASCAPLGPGLPYPSTFDFSPSPSFKWSCAILLASHCTLV